jgi:hypothetical protein
MICINYLLDFGLDFMSLYIIQYTCINMKKGANGVSP